MKVSSMTSPRTGNAVANQFRIEDGYGIEYFQSYNKIIARTWKGRCTVLDERYWNYSRTTSKYLNQFLGETSSEVRRKVKDGTYRLEDLNTEGRTKRAGVVGVDSGTLLIADPSYILSGKPERVYARGLDAFFETVGDAERGINEEPDEMAAQLHFDHGHEGAGVTVRPGYGDGVYDVYVTTNRDDRVSRITILCTED